MRSRAPLFAAAILIAAFALRAVDLSTPELWLDEVYSWAAAEKTWKPALLGLNVPPLYQVLLAGWISLFGESEAAMRSLSVVCGTLSIGVVMLAGRRMFGDRVALWSGAFAAIAPLHVYYSREARPYALLILTVALADLLLWRALERNDVRAWIGFVAAALAALASHLFAVFALAALAAWPWLWPEQGRVRPFFSLAFVGAGVLLVVFGSAILQHLQSAPLVGSAVWVDDLWWRTPPALAIPKSLEALVFGGHTDLLQLKMNRFEAALPPALRIFGLGVAIGLGLLVAMPRGEGRLATSWPARQKVMLAVALFGPLVLMWVVSWLRPVYVVGRYDLTAFPALALLIGVAVAKIEARLCERPVLRTLMLIVIAVPLVAKLVLDRRGIDDHAPSQLVDSITSRAADGDLVIFTEVRGVSIRYELDRRGWVWIKRKCEHPERGRRFACRVYPLASEPFDGAIPVDDSDTDRPQRDLETYLREAGGNVSAIHLVLGTFATSPAGALAATTHDTGLITEIVRAGFRAAAADVPRGLITYRR